MAVSHVGKFHQDRGPRPCSFQHLDLSIKNEPFSAVGRESCLDLFEVLKVSLFGAPFGSRKWLIKYVVIV